MNCTLNNLLPALEEQRFFISLTLVNAARYPA